MRISPFQRHNLSRNTRVQLHVQLRLQHKQHHFCFYLHSLHGSNYPLIIISDLWCLKSHDRGALGPEGIEIVVWRTGLRRWQGGRVVSGRRRRPSAAAYFLSFLFFGANTRERHLRFFFALSMWELSGGMGRGYAETRISCL